MKIPSRHLCLTFWLALLCLPVSFLYSQNQPSLSQLDWLVGSWLRDNAKSTTIESWQRLSEHTFEGISVRIAKATQDTVFSESLLLAEMGSDIYYLAKVPENAFPIPFKLTSFTKDSVVFENASHDFPQKISYVHKAINEMTVTISGDDNGMTRKISFPFKKIVEDKQQ